jgi:peptidoglycan/LPS O-acetylase OafA/YrhL
VLLSLSIVPLALWRGKKRRMEENLLIMLILSAYGFFLFSWHVHEKASLMMLLPMTLLIFMVGGVMGLIAIKSSNIPFRICDISQYSSSFCSVLQCHFYPSSSPQWSRLQNTDCLEPTPH